MKRPPGESFGCAGTIIQRIPIACFGRLLDAVPARETSTRIKTHTPETHAPRTKLECYGKEATQKNKELVEGQQVTLIRDVSETDQFGRLLRYVYKGDMFINDYLVKEGFAKASRYPPDVAFAELFRDSERDARSNAKGLWGTVCATK
jgi:endonuclease YncB( thermonuclease family)